MKKSIAYPSFSPRNCTACWKCVEACPCQAIRKIGFLWRRQAMLVPSCCSGCNLCVRTCPNGCFETGK